VGVIRHIACLVPGGTPCPPTPTLPYRPQATPHPQTPPHACTPCRAGALRVIRAAQANVDKYHVGDLLGLRGKVGAACLVRGRAYRWCQPATLHRPWPASTTPGLFSWFSCFWGARKHTAASRGFLALFDVGRM
jgi:hypothetical protein